MEPILRTAQTSDWITIVLLLSLLFLVLAKGLFYGRFMNFIILPFNNKYIFMYNKKEKLFNWFHIFFTIFQIINFALFVFFARDVLFSTEVNPYPLMYPVLLGCITIFVILKIAVQLANGFIFGSSKIISQLIFKKLSYLNYSGIIMFIANMLLAYVLKDPKPVVFIAIFLILLINVAGWITMLRNHQKFITNYFFYFILYLCALEISPFIIIGSYLKQ
ncbi:DUF4271 domain-containing protein [Pareuzebyella sediminis]|uniref:DUF4271 domain-containing protein n=1 Tax=Pareuzebyella sediminis TaxID=2607998 RepID=UPI0011ECDEFA|nr:DUF4271 domain-containing protein [Pareuzebyella sediminis]